MPKPFRLLSRLLLPVLALVCVAGCSSDSADDEIIDRDFPAIHVEASDTGRGAREIVMPVTGLHFAILGRPIVPQGNFLGVLPYQVGEEGLRRDVLLVQVDDTAATALYRLSAVARDKRLFLLMGDRPVGVHLLNDVIHGSNVFFEIEVPGATPEARHKEALLLNEKLNTVILKVRKKKEQK